MVFNRLHGFVWPIFFYKILFQILKNIRVIQVLPTPPYFLFNH